MYPDLYKRLNLKSKDLLKYDSPLVGFDRKVVIPKGMIKLHVQIGAKTVKVEFIVVDAYSLYTAISSTLHMKLKYPMRGKVGELVGSQAMVRRCLVAAIGYQSEDGISIAREEVP